MNTYMDTVKYTDTNKQIERSIQSSLIYQHSKSKPKHIYRFKKTYLSKRVFTYMAKSLQDKTKHQIKLKKKQYPSMAKPRTKQER